MTSKDEAPRSESVQYANGEEWRAITNSSRKSEEAGPKWERRSVVDVSGGESEAWCGKEQHCIEPGMLGPRIKGNGTWSRR